MSNFFKQNTFFTRTGHFLCVRLGMSELRAHIPALVKRSNFLLASWLRNSHSLWTRLLGMVRRTRKAPVHLLVRILCLIKD